MNPAGSHSEALLHELTYYTLGHPDLSYFIHQHVVDAYNVQQADENTSPIGIYFSLAGLYLFLENGYTGRQVQKAHMHIAMHKKPWPKITLPAYRGDIKVADVVQSLPGPERDQKIKDWCKSVWEACGPVQEEIRVWAKTELRDFSL